MNEFEKLEAELKELQPAAPSEQFISRLEDALGDAGNVAMRCMPDEEENRGGNPSKTTSSPIISFPRLVAFTGLAGLGLAAVWAMVFYLSSSLAPTGTKDLVSDLAPEDSLALAKESSLAQVEDPESPLHGLSLDEIQDISVMPVSGWLDPQMNERFLRVVDEGIFQRPGGLPARRVRHFFMDETLWSHPASDTRILSTTPREEVILIELDTY